MKLLSKVGAIFDGIINYLAIFSAALIILCVLAVSGEVLVRASLGLTTPWVVETTRIALLFITFLGAAWVLKREAHVSMDALITRVKPKTQHLLIIITSIISSVVCMGIVWYSARMTWDYIQTGYMITNGLRFPGAPMIAIIAVGSFLLSLQFIRRAYAYLQSWRELPNER